MNYAIVYLGAILFFAMLYWVVRGRKFYTGPLIEADVNEDASQQSSNDEIKHKTDEHGSVIA